MHIKSNCVNYVIIINAVVVISSCAIKKIVHLTASPSFFHSRRFCCFQFLIYLHSTELELLPFCIVMVFLLKIYYERLMIDLIYLRIYFKPCKILLTTRTSSRTSSTQKCVLDAAVAAAGANHSVNFSFLIPSLLEIY